MDSSSSLGQPGLTPPQTSTSRAVDDSSSSGAVVDGRKVYAFEQGFCIIPEEDFIKGFKKAPGALFHAAGQRIAIVVPPRKSYPHLTLDVQESYSLYKKPPRVKVRIAHAHYSPESGPTLAFHCHGVQLFPDDRFDRNVLLRVQRYLERSPLPFRLPESLLTEQPEAAPMMTIKEVEPTASSSASGGASAQLEELSLEEQELAESPTSSSRPKRKRHSSRGSKHKALKKTTPESLAEKPVESPVESPAEQAKAAKKDVKKLWRDGLDLDNFLEALDTLTVDQFSDGELKYAVIFFGLGRQHLHIRLSEHRKKIEQRVTAIGESLSTSANLLEASMGRDAKSRYQQSAEQSRLKTVEGYKVQVEEESGASMAALDYGLHELTPADLLAAKNQPSRDERTKFRGYQCAMLLLFRMQALECHGLRCLEYLSMAFCLCVHVELACHDRAPVLQQYFENLKNCLQSVQAKVTADNATRRPEKRINADHLKRYQASLEPSQHLYEQALQLFYFSTSLLTDISKGLPTMTKEDWQHLTENGAAEFDRLASLNVENREHWLQALESLEWVRDQIMRSGAGTSTASSI